jgi:hypothetical protein
MIAMQSTGIAEDLLIFLHPGKQVTEAIEPFGQHFEVFREVGGHIPVESIFPLNLAMEGFLNTNITNFVQPHTSAATPGSD